VDASANGGLGSILTWMQSTEASTRLSIMPQMLSANLLHFLDDHQGAVVALLTALLVFVTMYYALQNRQMVVEMRRSRNLTVLPRLALDFHRLGPNTVTLAIKNVGPGAALNIDVNMVWEPLSSGEGHVERRWRRNILASGEQADFMPPGDLNGNMDLLPSKYQRIRLQGVLTDAAGKRHDVEEAFDALSEWREVLAGVHQRYVAADPERRLAEAFFKKFDAPIRDLLNSVRAIAGALRKPPPEEP
jgi:hypothetical protein